MRNKAARVVDETIETANIPLPEVGRRLTRGERQARDTERE